LDAEFATGGVDTGYVERLLGTREPVARHG